MRGLPAVRMAWDTLNVESILNSKGFTKRGTAESSLVFAGVTKPMVGATSNVRLEKASKDPVFIIDSDFPYRKALRQFQLARAG